MEKKKFAMRRVLDLFEAVNAVADNDLLSVSTSHHLGRLGDKCKSESRVTVRLREKLQRKLQAQAESKNAEQVAELSSQFLDELDALLDIESGEIEVPEFKRQDFEAREDITNVREKNGEKSTTVIKKGQSLVPVKFFALMGDLIKD